MVCEAKWDFWRGLDGLLARYWAGWTSGEILGQMDFWRPNGLLAAKCGFWRVFRKGYVFGPNGFLACVENWCFWALCIGHVSCILFEFYVFLSVSVWVLLTFGTIRGSVAFGAELEDDKEEAEPEDAAPPGC